ncbi:MAG: hypothetical protein K2F88_07810 [Duncaniella sp.]|nr:hypothetical protein [Duncaniella sp.]
MKNLIRLMLLAATIFALAVSAGAQQRKTTERLSREQLAEKQAQLIAEKLAFNPETTKKFIDTYTRCQKEIWALGTTKSKSPKRRLTEMQTDSLIRARFNHSQKLLDIRKKYYAEYSKFLAPSQIEKVYSSEGKVAKKLSQRAKRQSKDKCQAASKAKRKKK